MGKLALIASNAGVKSLSAEMRMAESYRSFIASVMSLTAIFTSDFFSLCLMKI